MSRIRWRLTTSLGAGLLVAALLVPLASATTTAPTVRTDWSTVVDFSGTGLSRYSPADAALIQVLDPRRMKDSTRRVALQRQLDGLVRAQRAAKAAGATDAQVRRIRSPFTVQSIDPYCQLTSSTPGGYDLCGYNSTGDTMSAFASGRRHVMYAAVQEADDGGLCGGWPGCWRAWAKSVAVGLSDPTVNHWTDLLTFEAWDGPSVGSAGHSGRTQNPAEKHCLPTCYWTGAWHGQLWEGSPGSVSVTGATFITRDSVAIDNTADFSLSDNHAASYWWDRGSGIWCNGPNGYGIGC